MARTTAELRRAEREILASFLSHVRTRALASDTFGWADDIPELIKRGPTPAPMSGTPTQARGHPRPDAWPRWDDGLAYGNAG